MTQLTTHENNDSFTNDMERWKEVTNEPQITRVLSTPPGGEYCSSRTALYRRTGSRQLWSASRRCGTTSPLLEWCQSYNTRWQFHRRCIHLGSQVKQKWCIGSTCSSPASLMYWPIYLCTLTTWYNTTICIHLYVCTYVCNYVRMNVFSNSRSGICNFWRYTVAVSTNVQYLITMGQVRIGVVDQFKRFQGKMQ